MDSDQMPHDEQEFEELVKLLEGYESSQRQGLGPLPGDLQEIMANVKRAKGQQSAAQQATQEITPQPGYVIKTSDEQQRKVFINVCHSSHVPAPSSWADGMAPEKVLKALEDLQHNTPNTDAEAMRFAISVSELQPDTDKQGQPCVTVDCIINSNVMAAVQQSRPLKAFVNELTVDYVSQKHKLQLDQKYKLPKMNYKGTEIRSQRVKLDPKPLVSDITSTRDNDEPSFPLVPSKAVAAAKKAKAAAAAKPGQQQPAAAAGAAAGPAAQATSCSWQHQVEFEGKPVTHVVVSVQLPAPSSSSSSWQDTVQVQLCGTQLKVSGGHKQQQQQPGTSSSSTQWPSQQEPTSVCIHLPFAANPEGAEAELHRSTGQLVVRLPYLPLQDWVAQLQREAPHAFSKLPVAHDSYMELDD